MCTAHGWLAKPQSRRISGVSASTISRGTLRVWSQNGLRDDRQKSVDTKVANISSKPVQAVIAEILDGLKKK